MTLDIFTFCDFAQESKGKMTIVGTFNILQLQKFPSLYQNLYIAIRVSFSPEEVGDHTLKLSLKHKDLGNDVLPPLELTTQTVINDGRYSSINLPLNAQSVTFDSKGTYICNVSVDDNKLNQTIELYVE